VSSLSLRLPESIHRKVRELAKRDGVSINQFIATAVAEKTATLLTVADLEERARKGSARLFDRILRRVPNEPPATGDELSPRSRPAGTRRVTRRAARRRINREA
jgi:hypothetical protein